MICVFSHSRVYPRESGLQLMAVLLYHSNPETGLPLLHDDGTALAGVEQIWFTREDSSDRGPKYLVFIDVLIF